ncbi:unnamed protein product [Hydatigera taeniaeformis]|uniref:Secreted protein n=1 Tax=Hydatigena taeniaeformis TaxID=6205 RepID=A0A0R3WWD2_HYDTA|nr:unnamed protein product [Hydatigera taeniaeformis]
MVTATVVVVVVAAVAPMQRSNEVRCVCAQRHVDVEEGKEMSLNILLLLLLHPSTPKRYQLHTFTHIALNKCSTTNRHIRIAFSRIVVGRIESKTIVTSSFLPPSAPLTSSSLIVITNSSPIPVLMQLSHLLPPASTSAHLVIHQQKTRTIVKPALGLQLITAD